MSSLLVKSRPADASGETVSVTPGSAEWTYVGFQCLHLQPGQRVTGIQTDREICLVLTSGFADVEVGESTFRRLGSRSSVFDDVAPDAVYVPPGLPYTVTSSSEVVLAVCSAPSKGGHPVRAILAKDIESEVRGTGSNVRHVRNILPETETADSLLIVEVITPGGNWSSYPPHKHDERNLPDESALEETYYHRLNPPQGFAFQRVYTLDRSLDETMSVEDGDVVMVPKGYHPVGAPHGYDLYYLNVMAGPVRTWRFQDDPDHAWLGDQSPNAKV